MTLQQLMIAYQENRRDIFVLHYSNEEEIARIGAVEYFTADFDTAYGDCEILQFLIGVVDEFCLVFSVFLDIEDPNEESD
jgi:hypothetical protein